VFFWGRDGEKGGKKKGAGKTKANRKRPPCMTVRGHRRKRKERKERENDRRWLPYAAVGEGEREKKKGTKEEIKKGRQ